MPPPLPFERIGWHFNRANTAAIKRSMTSTSLSTLVPTGKLKRLLDTCRREHPESTYARGMGGLVAAKAYRVAGLVKMKAYVRYQFSLKR